MKYCIRIVGRNPDNPKSREVGLPTEQMIELRDDPQILGALTTIMKDNMLLEVIYEKD